MNEPKLVTLYRDTLTLKWPTLEDFLKLYWEAKPLTIVDMNYYKVSGRLPGAKGLDIKLVKSCRATYDKILVFDRPDVKIVNGTIELLDNVGLHICARTKFENVTITGQGLKWHRRLNPYLINVSGAVVEFVECIIESEATQESHAVLVTNGGEVDVTESRIYGACPPGTAIKVAGGAVRVRNRCLLQGGVLLTSPQTSTASDSLPGTVAGSIGISGGTVGLVQDQTSENGVTDNLQSVAGAEEFLGASSEAVGRQLRGDGEPGQQTGEALGGISVQAVGNHGSYADLRASEIREGVVAALSVFGPNSKVVLDGCQVGGKTNYGIMASHGAQVELVANCDIHGASVAGVMLSSGAKLRGKHSLVGGHLIGLLVERRAFADMAECKMLSDVAGTSDVPLPPPPKPGFLPSPAITPAVAEVRGDGSVLKTVDCIFGRDNTAKARAVAGGVLIREDGVAAATA